MAMKLPSITIAFQTAGIEAIGRSEKGVVALLLKGTEDGYIGKYPNSYDNKCLLMTAIDGYLEQLYLDELIQEGWTVEINMEKTRAYLKSVGVDVSGLSDYAVRRADTGDKVFIRIKSSILDAIEEIDIDANI